MTKLGGELSLNLAHDDWTTPMCGGGSQSEPGVTAKNHEINHHVDQNHEAAQYPLKLARKRRRVEDGNEIVLNEADGVRRPTAFLAKPVFERRERTDPACELHPRTPTGRGKMHPSDSWPTQDEQAPEDYEQNEA